MEAADLDLIQKHSGDDMELKALYDQHVEFGRMLDKIENRPYLSPTQQQEVKELKKKKLAGKTKLFGFFVGQVMKATKGKANPKVVNDLLRDELGKRG